MVSRSKLAVGSSECRARPHGIDRGKGQQLLFSARHGEDVPPPQPLQMQVVGGIIQPTEDLARATP